MKVLMIAAAAAAAITASTSAAQACPDWRAAPTFGDINLSAGFLPDPYQRRITAGGTHSISNCLGNNWAGFVARKPDFDLYWDGSTNAISILVDTQADSVLLINDPNGTWHYNDDISGSDTRSGVRITNPPAGLYDIWIGSFDGSRRNPGTLLITEN